MDVIDLRSDTVTLPSVGMLEAIGRAELGDDVFGEDPTVKCLEELAADRLGKKAGLFVPSGTMANLVSVMTHCGRGDEAIVGDQAHIHYYEAGGMSAIGSIHPRIIPNQKDGTLAVEIIAAAIRPDNVHFPKTRLVCLENTHNRCGGAVLKPEYVNLVCRLAHDNDLKVHIDGARIFNASTALELDVKELTAHADSVSICLSKSLGAPVGSVVCSTSDFIIKARRIRKVLGGGMRQAGVVAAAGIYALENMVERLIDDHDNAKRLGEGIAAIDGLDVKLETVQTNMVYFNLTSEKLTADEFVQQCKGRGLLFIPISERRFRMVTHFGIETEHIDTALNLIQDVMGNF